MRFLNILQSVLLLLVLVLGACGDSAATSSDKTPQQVTPTQGTTILSAVTPSVTLSSQPEQPLSGPGGSSYKYGESTSSSFGEGSAKYYIYEPANPTPATAPVIALLHGYTDINPQSYKNWIDHLVRRGNIVIFPVYQATIFDTNGSKFTDTSLIALKEALAQLQQNGKVKPELDKFMLVGYSAGGIIATNLAGRATTAGLPEPRALFDITPGGCNNCGAMAIGGFPLELEALPAIPASMKMLVLVGDKDIIVGDKSSKVIWQNTSQISPENRDFIKVISDNHGTPALIADHGMSNRRKPDALNYYGIWKLTDALQSCALYNTECDNALGNTPAQRFMGKWSDGTAVTELVVTKKP
ncbi:alpha/beta hydrolase [Candidatus Chlorohelix sp.]|uniref:alpha/beta hydrolase n=1 Tax=Candidatus Chlorohelix sp. TaxID=3139201 RepID=UPI003059AFBE